MTIIEWANKNDGFIGLATFLLLSVLIPLGFWFVRKLSSRLSSSVSAEEVRRIEGIRAEFYTRMKVIDERSAYGPFLIRDVSRDRLYFDGDDAEFSKPGPPPSFKVTVVDMDVHGVRVYSGQPERIKRIADEQSWCLAQSDDPGFVLAHPIGVIPFSSIVAVNWHGDPATHYPHIYCHFDQVGGWPFKRFEYCERQPCIRGLDLYIRLVAADDLIRRKF
jgi:hypothetical protein